MSGVNLRMYIVSTTLEMSGSSYKEKCKKSAGSRLLKRKFLNCPTDSTSKTSTKRERERDLD